MTRMFLFFFSILALAKSAVAAGEGDYETSCIYSFTNPSYPSFTLPSAQPNSPGDVQLNKNNPIRFANGSRIAAGQGCNSGLFSYYDERSEQFLSSYSDANEQTSSIGDMIYATNHDQLYARTIQLHQANLASFLVGKTLKIDLTCNNGLTGCALFTVGSQLETSSAILATTSYNQATRLHATFIFFVSCFFSIILKEN